MANPFRLGFLTHLEGAGDPQRIYAETLELFVAAEQLGFEVGWVAQHHLQPDAGRLSAPFPFLAAVAQHTRLLRLGTAVVILPLEHPIRLAEDAALVDALSGGRLELGVGGGFDPRAFAAFGIDAEQRQALMATNLPTMQRALRGEPLGQTDWRLEPPASTLANRLWLASLSAGGADFAARSGVGLLLSRTAYDHTTPTDQIQRVWAHDYSAACQAAGLLPRIGLSRTVYPARDPHVARTQLAAGVARFVQNLARQGRLPPDLTAEAAFRMMHIFTGTPEEVAAGLAADTTLPYATDLICQFGPAAPSHAEALAALELIATEVAPALGWRPHASNDAEVES